MSPDLMRKFADIYREQAYLLLQPQIAPPVWVSLEDRLEAERLLLLAAGLRADAAAKEVGDGSGEP